MLAVVLASIVRWAAPDGCPSAEEAVPVVDAALDGAQDVDVAVNVAAEGNAYVVHVEVRRAEATIERSVPLEACEQSVDAAAVVVALAVDTLPEPSLVPAPDPGPEPEPEPPAPTVVPEPEPEPTPEPRPTEAPTPSGPAAPPDEERPARLPWRVGVASGLGLRAIGALGAQARGEFGITFDRWLVEFTVDHWIRRTERVPAPPDAGARISLTTARIAGGYRPSVGRVSFPLMGFVGGGVLRGVGVDVADARSTLTGVAVLGVAAGTRVSLAPRWALLLQAEALLSTPSRRFALSDGVFIDEAGGFGGLFMVGVSFGPGAG